MYVIPIVLCCRVYIDVDIENMLQSVVNEFRINVEVRIGQRNVVFPLVTVVPAIRPMYRPMLVECWSSIWTAHKLLLSVNNIATDGSKHAAIARS